MRLTGFVGGEGGGGGGGWGGWPRQPRPANLIALFACRVEARPFFLLPAAAFHLLLARATVAGPATLTCGPSCLFLLSLFPAPSEGELFLPVIVKLTRPQRRPPDVCPGACNKPRVPRGRPRRCTHNAHPTALAARHNALPPPVTPYSTGSFRLYNLLSSPPPAPPPNTLPPTNSHPPPLPTLRAPFPSSPPWPPAPRQSPYPPPHSWPPRPPAPPPPPRLPP